MQVLRQELEAREGSFLLRLRVEREWDREAFSRLEGAMRAACTAYEGDEQLPRWLADGFYYVSVFVPSCTQHEHFPRPEDAYYRACLQRIEDLASWFFSGESPYVESHRWQPL